MRIVRDEGVFRLYDRQTTLILTDEKQLRRIAENPEQPLFDDEERGFSGEKKGLYPPGTTLDSFMREAHEKGCTRVEVSYDFFFGGTTRENYPDSELTVRAYKRICEAAAAYGMSFGASVVSPLDLGGGYVRTHTDRGYSWQMAEGAIENGEYRVEMRRQLQWYNNKGPIKLQLNRVMAYAFDEAFADNGRDLWVDADAMTDISSSVRYEVDESRYKLTSSGYAYDVMTVHGKTDAPQRRVLILAEYATPEQDYFASDALDYMKSVIDLHNENGIRYQGFYSDEMHIQFDWDLGEHFGPTEIQTRYVTDSLIEEFARRYGRKYLDFPRYMIYFAYMKHEDGSFRSHMSGPDANAAYETVLFRKRYFEMLSERIVSLSMQTKNYAESLFGGPIMTRAHSTWQESPTCDHFSEDFAFSEENRADVTRYDYDKPYVWSSTIRENTSACGDYFRWNEYLTGCGTDHAEGGNADRNYYAEAFTCSLGRLNRFDRAYCACWGSPKAVLRRFNAVAAAYGTGNMNHALVQDWKHRLSDVLMLYPTELNYAEERFGSWMVQYGYCDYITEEKLLEKAECTVDGKIRVGNHSYGTLVALFEPFITRRTMELLKKFVLGGGRLLWTGPAALRYEEDGSSAEEDFLALFGLKTVSPLSAGLRLPDADISFCGDLEGIRSMRPLTDLLPDAVYPVVCDAPAATVNGMTVGSVVQRGKGIAAYLGFRPRDDQSKSLGGDVSALFDVLMKLGAYPAGSLEALSRPESARYIVNRFENGCVTVANHYRTFGEAWYGSFFRDDEKDAELLKGRQLPPVEIELADAELCGHRVSFRGTDAMSYRLDTSGKLTGFAGSGTDGITVDGHAYRIFSEEADVCFALVDESRLESGIARAIAVKADRAGHFTIPVTDGFENAEAGVCGRDFYETDAPAALTLSKDALEIDVDEKSAGKWILIYVRK